METVSLNSMARPTAEVDLVSLKGGKVILYKEMLVAGTRLVNANKDLDNYERGLKMLELSIKEWNITDDNGAVLEINEDNLSKFTQKDLMVMLNGLYGGKEDKKKE